ncbi:exodeoxyribonuclease V subunit beta [Flocculibacter collagenilyticus]|uniref:exodeoxyribonuclease V subunit beta n=1 Tax=Flocculibacter collagenilyticus TaxID=2744479 RepID=UPI0018F56893|nr:exodeoxyribonuclease V subunit beta [Flocculibacter collagenilyticus]
MAVNTTPLDEANNTVLPTSLNPLTLPLTGSILIEASAGTGKTYTITTLYVRLLLGLTNTNPLLTDTVEESHVTAPQCYTVEQILVVTFTEAATQEIRDRVRARINEAKWAVFTGQSSDPLLITIVDQIEDRHLAFHRLDAAAKLMDQAAIFTIHGFCHRMLTQHAFESGSLFEQEFILEQTSLVEEATKDYWRKYVVPQSLPVMTFIRQFWLEPTQLQKDIEALLYKEGVVFSPRYSFTDEIKQIEHYQTLVKKVKHAWLEEDIESMLLKSDIRGNKAAVKSDRLAAMNAFCHSNQLDFVYKANKKESFELWAQSDLQNPKSLKGKKVPPTHWVFDSCEQLALMRTKIKQQLKAAIIQDAVTKIKQLLIASKLQNHQISADELLTRLHSALHGDHQQALIDAISSQYPIAMIDEFQDTDPIQYGIFSSIYQDTSQSDEVNACWVMIGDPKQAIYGFRGADIFTYIKAKHDVEREKYYTLDTNWRSSDDVVTAVNYLFSSSQNAFIYDQDIPFLPVKAAGKASKSPFKINNKAAAGLQLSYLPSEDDTPIAKGNALPLLAEHSANQIATLLNLAEQGEANIGDRKVAAADICVLVRDRFEARTIKQALLERNIDSVFLSKDSVFASELAEDVYRLLSVLILEQGSSHAEAHIRGILLSCLFNYSITDIEQLNEQEHAWQYVLDMFDNLSNRLSRYGVMPLIQHLIYDNGLVKKWRTISRYSDNVERLITDLRHLGEILQQKQMELGGLHKLLFWFEQQITSPELNKAQQMRLESDQNLIQIVTMHASKGLEYNIVFLPFISSYRAVSSAIYHNELDQLTVDLTNAEENLSKAEKEQLAEDLRLLYVALTRPVHQLNVNLYNCKEGQKKRSALTKTAIGYLLFGTVDVADINNGLIQQQLINLVDGINESTREESVVTNNMIANYCDASTSTYTRFQAVSHNTQAQLVQHHFSAQIDDYWRVTSYSALIHAAHSTVANSKAATEEPSPPEAGEVQPGMDDELHFSDFQPVTVMNKNRFNFEKGANAGSCLHEIFEEIDFTSAERDYIDVIIKKLNLYGIDESWAEVVYEWVCDVLDTPLDKDQHALADVHNKLIEMEFHMAISTINAAKLNALLSSQVNRNYKLLSFSDVQGVLKGFIDLVYEFNGRYYVLDYKSNHLGENTSDYTPDKLEEAMTSHHYHLQYLIYVVALQRYLSLRLPNYDYDMHIGGVYYLFLRGMSANTNDDTGIFRDKPPKQLIDQLDALFTGTTFGLNSGSECDSSKHGATLHEQQQLGLF